MAPNESLLRRLWLQTNLYCTGSGSKRISTAQALAPNESLLHRLWLQTNLYCTGSGSKRISTAQALAPNESLLHRLWLQTNLYCTGSGSKRISTAQALAPNESLLHRLWLQTNLYCTGSGSKRISNAQALAPNESLLHRLWLQTNLYCTGSGSKRISTAQTLAPDDIIYSRWQQIYWDAFASIFYSGIFFYSLWYTLPRLNEKEIRKLREVSAEHHTFSPSNYNMFKTFLSGLPPCCSCLQWHWAEGQQDSSAWLFSMLSADASQPGRLKISIAAHLP